MKRRSRGVLGGSRGKVVLAFTGLVIPLAIASAAWACLTPHLLVVASASGASPNNDVRVAGVAHIQQNPANNTQGTYNVFLDPNTDKPESWCTGTGDDIDVGDITYPGYDSTNPKVRAGTGVGEGTIDMPSGLAKGKYWICAEPDTSTMRAQYTVTSP